jgi:hypothetical protein
MIGRPDDRSPTAKRLLGGRIWVLARATLRLTRPRTKLVSSYAEREARQRPCCSGGTICPSIHCRTCRHSAVQHLRVTGAPAESVVVAGFSGRLMAASLELWVLLLGRCSRLTTRMSANWGVV